MRVMWFLLVILCIASIGTAAALGEDWIIDGDKVYIDDVNAYISAEPHTLTNSGYLNVTVISKGYSGNVDLAFLIVTGDLTPTSADVSINGNGYTSIVNHFDKYTYSYDGFDTVYLGRNLPVTAGTEYNLRVWIDIPARPINSKYGIAIKPSSKTLQESITQGYFYYLDPWVNTTGGDHAGADWTVNNSDTIGGNHYNVGTFTITSGYTVNLVTGSPLKIVADIIYINGTINGNGKGYVGGAAGNNPADGGTGGGSGGGGGGGSDSSGPGGGGGAGYGGVGGAGAQGAGAGGTPGAAGGTYGTLNTKVIDMGSGGGGGGGAGTGTPGGRGGGSVTLAGPDIYIFGTINLNGANGGINGGGGSGGGFLGVGNNITVSGTISANAGAGGSNLNADYGSAGGGGGGRVKLFNYTSLNTTGGTITVTKGLGGTGSRPAIDGAIGTTFEGSNSPPPTPTILIPTNNSDQGSTPVTLNVTATDTDGDTLTYYYYGDLIDASTEINTSASNYEWNILTSDTYYWKARAFDGVLFSDYTDVQQFTSFIPPNLISPVNGSTVYTTYPPLTYDTTFTWQDTGTIQYRLEVADDENFNINVVDVHVATNASTQTLIVNTEYFWRVFAYDGSAYSGSSDIYRFNLTGNSTLSGSAIEGVVYVDENGVISSISGAEITIWNTTWSDTAVTGSNGYYVFHDLTPSQVYNLQASADKYLDSTVILITATADPATRDFYMIADLTDTEWWHYVEFTIQNFWGTTYSDVDVTVYEGDSLTEYASGETGTDGTITFHLNQNIEYRLTFISATQGINQEFTVYPISDRYIIYTTTTSYTPVKVRTDDIVATVEGIRINATYGYINFTWTDTTAQTSTYNYWINDTDVNVLYTTSGSAINISNSQIVEATNDRYVVHYIVNHPTYGNVEHVETIAFYGGRRVDLGWSEDWQYAVTATLFLFFIAALFGSKHAKYGAVSISTLGWIFMWIGWYDTNSTSLILLILASLVSFGWILRKGEIPGR